MQNLFSCKLFFHLCHFLHHWTVWVPKVAMETSFCFFSNNSLAGPLLPLNFLLSLLFVFDCFFPKVGPLYPFCSCAKRPRASKQSRTCGIFEPERHKTVNKPHRSTTHTVIKIHSTDTICKPHKPRNVRNAKEVRHYPAASSPWPLRLS